MRKPHVFLCCLLFAVNLCTAQSVGINTANPSSAAQLDVVSPNKGILIPRIDYALRPSTNVVSGTLIYVIANGPDGNNAFYYYDGASWLKFRTDADNQQLNLTGTSVSISGGNPIELVDLFPVAGTIKCAGVYINPYTNNNNCGGCGNVCPGATICKNGTCQ